jgi:antitoxin (DNA-binding transcriptional repressor) of toxin-antitoxin stability system
MAKIGIRELKQSASAVLRRVRENAETIDVSYRGEVVARIVPVARAADRVRASDSRTRTIWADIDSVAEEIRARWPKGVTAVRAVRDQRRG